LLLARMLWTMHFTIKEQRQIITFFAVYVTLLNEGMQIVWGVMSGIMVDDTPIILINQTYYSFVGPHMGLDGMTPAEVAGIRMNEKDK